MRYFANYKQNGALESLTTNYGDVEITEAEYNRLLSEIRSKADRVDKVYADPSVIDLCPPEWRAEILQRVQERKDAEAEAKNAPISDAELGNMIQEVL